MSPEIFKLFFDRVNIICALDHSGRAGNYFFQSIFDQHTEVLTCPWVQYTYSSFVTHFGEEEVVDAREAHQYWTTQSYFRLVYNEVDDALAKTITSFGSDPKAAIDRALVREIFDALVLTRPMITRKEVILASAFAYGMGVKRDIHTIRYILVSDAVSLRTENLLTGFSGKIVPAIQQDFPQARFISLERDPRATFASCRQQYVNSNGNMYGIKFGNYFRQLGNLLRQRFTTEGCVFLFWLLYFASAARLIYHLKQNIGTQMLVIKNEDLNTRFIPTMKQICSWLRISFAQEWQNDPYQPTNVGSIWLGKGAYNSRYQKNSSGPLENDPDEIAKNITGPNVYVTERWKKRLARNEIAVIEFLFAEELRELSYEFLVFQNQIFSRVQFLKYLFMPFEGELPSWKWILRGREVSASEVLQRIFYFFSFFPFYLFSRLILMRYAFWGDFFALHPPQEQISSNAKNLVSFSASTKSDREILVSKH